MRSPSYEMLRSPARAGHGSIMCVTLFAAGASPAPKLTVSRRSRYMSVQAPSRVVAASARTAAARDLLGDDLTRDRDIVLSLGNVEDVTDGRRRAVRDAFQAAVHGYGDFALAEQEQVGVIARLRTVERRAQHIARPGRANQ